MSILSVQEVSKQYAKHTALNKVSIEVQEGRIFGLLGPNGAGKTSLIRIINQITAPDSGSIQFNNEPLNKNHISEIGYLPEERGLYKKMKVGEQAMYLARLKGLSEVEARKKLKYWFERFEIQSWWNKKVEELSKGMAQKVQFIVTVLHQPRLLILDEPFSGFDPINTNLIKSEILALKEQGTSVIFSTHNMGSVEEICDDIALINKAECILSGSVLDIKNSYKKGIIQVRYTGNQISLSNALWTDFELIESTTEHNMNVATIKLLKNNSTNNLLQALIPSVEIHQVNELVPSMNEIFIEKVTALTTENQLQS